MDIENKYHHNFLGKKNNILNNLLPHHNLIFYQILFLEQNLFLFHFLQLDFVIDQYNNLYILFLSDQHKILILLLILFLIDFYIFPIYFSLISY